MDPDDLALRPLVADILRTRYCIPHSLFLLESLDTLQPTRSPKWRALRLLLSDGDLCLQALLTLSAHRFVDGGDVAPGCLLRLHDFEVCFEEVAGGRMVYLCVEDFSVVGWCEEYARVHGLERPDVAVSPLTPSQRDQDMESGPRAPATEKAPITNPRLDPGREVQDSDSEDGFEAPRPADPPRTPTPPALLDDFPLSIPESPPHPLPPPVALLRDWPTPHNPLKLTPLASIPRLPYRQNWSINTLAIITSLSPPQPSTFPPYVQRVAHLADPSTEKRVHLTVFLEAEAFAPALGSVVLLAGVKNHLFDGGSLKKYVSDRPRNGIPWWFEEPAFAWCRDGVRELREWWTSQGDRHDEP